MAIAKRLSWITLLIFSAAVPAANADDAFAQRLREGTAEVRQGNFSSAMADFEAAVELDPNSSEAWYQLGLLLGQMADFESAETAFRRAIKLKPDFAQAHYSLGLALTANPKSKLDWPGAIVEFREALKCKPDYAEALNYLGAGLIATGDIDSAIPELEHAIRIKPDLSTAHFNLAIALERNDKLDDAVKEYRLAVSTRAVYPEASAALGKLLFRLKRTGEAEQELDNALRTNPDLSDAHYALARVLQSLDKKSEAAIEFDEAKDLAQREPDATQSSLLSNKALELAAKGDFKGAAAALRKAITLKPDYGIPHYNLGLILADQGDMAGAAQELTKAISLMPGQAKPWFDLGRVRERRGDHPGALQAVSWAARLSPLDAAIRAELAALRDASLKTGIGKATDFDSQPDLGAVNDTAVDHIAFAAELKAVGDFIGAVGELLRSLALQSDAFDVRRSLADCYMHLGDHDRAILEYHKIIRSRPEDAEAHFGLGKALYQKGNPKDAAAEFRLALAGKPDYAEARNALDRTTRELTKH